MITNNDIQEIYQIYLRNNNFKYLNKCVGIDQRKNTKMWTWDGKDFPRVAAMLDLQEYVEKYNIKSENMLLFYENEPEMEYIPHKNKYIYDYEKNEKYDLHQLEIPDKDYDFSMLCQTLEHLYDPLMCVKNIYKYLKDDSYFYINVPTINIQHMLPYNFYTGFTPVGLGCLLKNAGFKVLEIGHWGNFSYLNNLFLNKQWSDYNSINLINDFTIPCQTWALAKK